MSLSKLPSGRWRAQVYNPATGRNVSAASVLGGGPASYRTKTEAKAAREAARLKLAGTTSTLTVRDWWTTWTTDPLWKRPKESSDVHRAERTKEFVTAHADLPLAHVDDLTVARWLAGGARVGQVNHLRSMFADATKARAGRLIDRNPWSDLGIPKSKGNSEKPPPSEQEVWAMIEHARRLTYPAFAAWLQVAAFTGMRPGELDALRWTAVDWQRGRIVVREQWSAKVKKFTLPKNGLVREALLTPHARTALEALPRDSEWCFPNLRGRNMKPSSRAYHWNAVRAAAGWEETLYLATRHFAGSYMVNVLRLDSEDVAIALGHTDGGELVRKVYGHRSTDDALARVARAYANAGTVRPLRVTDARDAG